MLAAGDRIAERFVVEADVARGGTSVVYRAHDEATGRTVAVKLVAADARDARLRFAREAELLAELTHPGFARYVAHGQRGEHALYLAMEWIAGPTLRQRTKDAPLTTTEAVAVATRIADALSTLHSRGALHRDVKPSNVILRGGDPRDAVLIDLGIALVRGAGGHTRVTDPGMLVGTPAFMSPEQVAGEPVDARTDVHALGALLFYALTGRAPFTAPDERALLAKVVLVEAPIASSVRPGLSPSIDALVAALLAKSPEARPANGAEARALLASCLDDSPTLPAIAQRALGERELLVAAVLIVVPDAKEGGAGGRGQDDDELTARDSVRSRIVRVEGARLVELNDGTLVVTIASGAVATDLALRGAELALELREAMPDARIALVLGQRRSDRAMPVAEALDRAAALVSREGLEIRIDETTAALVSAEHAVEHRAGSFVLGGERRRRDRPRMFLGRPTGCVGRDRELAAMDALVDEAFAEPGIRVAVLRGPPGSGKSLLRRTLLAGVARHRASVWIGRADAMRTAQPYGVLATAVVGGLRLGPRDTGTSAHVRLVATLATRMEPARAGAIASMLGDVVGLTSASPPSAIDDAQLRADRIRGAWIELFTHLAASGPFVLALEDVHWADRASLAVVRQLAQRARELPIFVLACTRDERDDAQAPSAVLASVASHDLSLGPLSRRAAEQLVRGAVPDVDDATLARVVAQGDGNAFYLEELARALAEGRGAERPATVLAMSAARLSRLDPADRRLLRAASAFGESCWGAGVAHLLQASRADVEQRMEALATAEWLTEREVSTVLGCREWVFRHAFVRDAAYASLTEEDRALAHRLAASWLEAETDAEPAVLARHFELGGLLDRAALLYERAGEIAFERGDHAALRELTGAAERCGLAPERLAGLRVHAAEAARWAGAGASRELLEGLLAQLPRGSRAWFRCACELGVAMGARGDGDSLEALAAEIEAQPVDAPGALEARLALATPLYVMGRTERGERLVAPVQLARRGDETASSLSVALAEVLAIRDWAAGDLSGFVRESQRCLDHATLIGDERRAIKRRGDLGFGLLLLGRLDAAAATLRECHAAASALGMTTHATGALHNLGLALSGLGAHAEAREVERRAVQAFRAYGERFHEAASLAYLARIELSAGDPRAAELLADEALGVADAVSAETLLPLAQATRIEALRALGDPERARLDVERALARLRAGDNVESPGYVRLAIACWLLAVRDARADAFIRESCEALDAMARRIRDEPYRRSFAQRVPEHAALRQLAAARGVLT